MYPILVKARGPLRNQGSDRIGCHGHEGNTMEESAYNRIMAHNHGFYIKVVRSCKQEWRNSR